MHEGQRMVYFLRLGQAATPNGSVATTEAERMLRDRLGYYRLQVCHQPDPHLSALAPLVRAAG
jgi:hypothetical protein